MQHNFLKMTGCSSILLYRKKIKITERIQLMFLTLISNLPTVLLNLIIGSTLLVVQLRLKDAGINNTLITVAFSGWAIMSAATAFAVGKFLTERNALRFLVASSCMMICAFIGLLILPTPGMQFFWLALIGLATALFCAPVQVFLKKLQKGKSQGLVKASAFYSASWTLGMAVGALLFARLANYFSHAWQMIFAINIALSLLMLILPLTAQAIAGKESRDAGENIETEDPYAEKPDLALFGWVLTVAAFAAVAAFRNLMPTQGRDANLSEVHVGQLVAVLYFTHSIVSVLLSRSKDWMYRRTTVCISAVCAVIGLLIYILAFGNLFLMYAGAVLIGYFSGIVGFCLVFYSLANPVRAPKYVAVNEVVVGLTNTLTPILLVGLLVKWTGQVNLPYIVLILMAVLAIGSGFCFIRDDRRRAQD